MDLVALADQKRTPAEEQQIVRYIPAQPREQVFARYDQVLALTFDRAAGQHGRTYQGRLPLNNAPTSGS